MKSSIKIAFVVRTSGLEYDDRIRKECLSLSKNANIHLFVNFTDNREEAGVTSYGIPYQSFRLVTREELPSAKWLFLKSVEFFCKIAPRIRMYDLIWAHEEYTYLFPLLVSRKKCIWDLHELPSRFEKHILKSIFHHIERRSKGIVHANPHRIKHLIANGTIKMPEKHIFIRNYPDAVFSDSHRISDASRDENLSSVCSLFGASGYVYLQGLSLPQRYPENSLRAVLSIEDLNAVVIGGFYKEARMRMDEEYGAVLAKRVFFAGIIDQLKIPLYLTNALFNIILYTTDIPNSRYCEPNRLYQSIVMNVPVIVGCNEPMKEIVGEYGLGIVLTSDGRDLNELCAAVCRMKRERASFLDAIARNKHRFMWEQQNEILAHLTRGDI